MKEPGSFVLDDVGTFETTQFVVVDRSVMDPSSILLHALRPAGLVGATLTPDEARQVAKKLIEFADWIDDSEEDTP